MIKSKQDFQTFLKSSRKYNYACFNLKNIDLYKILTKPSVKKFITKSRYYNQTETKL